MQPSAELGAIVGNEKLPRSQVISKVWDYIKSNNLQNPENKREILADDKRRQEIFANAETTAQFMANYNKATNKALSVAMKYAMLEAFCIPTSDPKDPENDSPTLEGMTKVDKRTGEMSGAAVAINTQRFAPNLMTVVAADEFGNIADGNVGEILKFLPGVTAEFNSGEPRQVEIGRAHV